MRITRSHEIDAGHRVFGHEGKCANLHGHRYGFDFTCEGKLDSLGRVIDFSIMKTTLCQWLEDNWDHKMILWQEDPLGQVLRQHGQMVFDLPYNPTAENLARYLVDYIAPVELRPHHVRLISVTVHETAKCSACHSVFHE